MHLRMDGIERALATPTPEPPLRSRNTAKIAEGPSPYERRRGPSTRTPHDCRTSAHALRPLPSTMLPRSPLHRRSPIRFPSYVLLPLLAWVLAIFLWDTSVERAAQDVVGELGSPDAAVQAVALERLGATSPAALIRSFGRLNGDERGKATLGMTVQALGQQDSATVVPLLIAALSDDHDAIRARAAMALAFLGADAMPAVIDTLRSSPDVRVRTSAAWILSLMGTKQPAAVEALQAALDDENKDVRYTAKYSLHQLTTSNNLLRETADRMRFQQSTPDD